MGSAHIQGTLWGAAADDWAEHQEPTQAPLYETTFDALGVTNGTRLLDAGCGAGHALQLAAKRGAEVTGLDASAGLLRVARRRLPDSDIRQGDIEKLPYGDGMFDAVTAFNSVQYASDPTAALREMRRVTRPGAPVAISTWGDPARCETRGVLAAMGSLMPPPPPGTGGPFALSAPGALEELVERAGLTAEKAMDVPTPFVYVDVASALRANLASGPGRVAIDHAGADAVRDALAVALAPFAGTDGQVRLENVFRVVVARA
jgi:SAM-dependent methyltransferase